MSWADRIAGIALAVTIGLVGAWLLVDWLSR